MWIHIPSRMWYVGSKSSATCHPDYHEKYICSSRIVKPLVKKNRSEWTYTILAIGDKKYIRELEKKYLRLLNAKNDPTSFNKSNACVEYDRSGLKDSLLTRQKKSAAKQGELNPMFGKRGKACPHYGKQHSLERKQKQSEGVKKYAANRPDSHNQNISNSLKGNPNVGVCGERNGMFGKTASEYNKQMSKLKNSGKNNPMCKPENQKICEYCKKTVAKNHYTMFHGEKCKTHKDELVGRVENVLRVVKENGFTSFDTAVDVA